MTENCLQDWDLKDLEDLLTFVRSLLDLFGFTENFQFLFYQKFHSQ